MVSSSSLHLLYSFPSFSPSGLTHRFSRFHHRSLISWYSPSLWLPHPDSSLGRGLFLLLWFLQSVLDVYWHLRTWSSSLGDEMRENTQLLSLQVQVISGNVFFSRSWDTVAWKFHGFTFFTAGYCYSVVHTHRMFIMHLSLERLLRGFHILTTVAKGGNETVQANYSWCRTSGLSSAW